MTAESHSAHHHRVPSHPRHRSPLPREREDLHHQIERNRVSRHGSEELEALQKRLAELESRQRSQEEVPRHVSTSGNIVIEADSPLAPELTRDMLPAKIKIPQIGMYDGASDPDTHLGLYTSWMDLHGATDALRCRMFSLTLGPRAQKWYYTLPPHSIWRWQQLRSAFRTYFIGAQVCLIPKESITNIVQKDDETVKDYVSRFNDRIQNMEPCHPETLLVTAIAGLKPNSMFRWTLCQNKPATFQEFLVRAQQYIIAEESMSVPTFDFPDKHEKLDSEGKKKNKKNFGKNQYRGYSKRLEKTPESRAARDQYVNNMRTGYHTVYSVGEATIFEELKGKGIIPDPKPVRTSEDKLDKSRYCAYHKSPGHNTDECFDLLSSLLRLIGQPQLQKFRRSDTRRKGRPADISDDEDEDDRDNNLKRIRTNDKEVFTFSTLNDGECKKFKAHDVPISSQCIPRINANTKQLDTSRRKAKAYARQAQNAGKQVMNVDLRDVINKRNCPITFTIDDANMVAHPHSDPLVITTPIGGIPVHRILVDTGAYSRILMFHTFKKMGLDPADIRPCNDQIQGFNG
ncbi:Unknown protein, partial [Striga hermonthica]